MHVVMFFPKWVSVSVSTSGVLLRTLLTPHPIIKLISPRWLRCCCAHYSVAVTCRGAPRGPNTLNCTQQLGGLMSCVKRHFSTSDGPHVRVYFRESNLKEAKHPSSVVPLDQKPFAATNGGQPGLTLFGATLKCSEDLRSGSRGAQSETPPPLCESAKRKQDTELRNTWDQFHFVGVVGEIATRDRVVLSGCRPLRGWLWSVTGSD